MYPRLHKNLKEDLKQHLRRKGFKVAPEVWALFKKAESENWEKRGELLKRADVGAIDEKGRHVAYAVETKLKTIAKGIGDCIFYQYFAHKTYLVIPSDVYETLKESDESLLMFILKRTGIGLLLIRNGEVSEKEAAKETEPLCSWDWLETHAK